MRVTLERNDGVAASGFLQSRSWAEFKARAGWTWARYEAETSFGPTAERFPLSVLERRLGPGVSFAYVPRGPEYDPGPAHRTELLAALAESLAPSLGRACAFVRFDPPWYAAESPAGRDGGEGEAEGRGHTEASAESAPSGPERPTMGKPLFKGADVQPPDSVVIGLRKDDGALLAAMKPKWRYNVRLALKKGVLAQREGPGSLAEFYALYEATARRDRISIHPEAYYRRLLEGAAEAASADPSARPQAIAAEPVSGHEPAFELWMARSGGKALAGIITVSHGSEATYLYGASGDEGRELMPAYALQWAAMRSARDAGAASYDLYGIPPSDDPSHPMSGLYRFKTGFGGEIRHYAGAWDCPLKPAVYAAYRAAEAGRLFWHKRVRKSLGR